MRIVGKVSLILSMLGLLGGLRLQFRIVGRSSFTLNYKSGRAGASEFSTLTSPSPVDVKEEPSSILKRGQSIRIKVTSFGPLGASVQVNGVMSGLVLQKELSMFRDRRNGVEVSEGEVLDAFVEKVRESGKVDVSLRPVVQSRIELAKSEVLEALKQAPGGVINLGDKSKPEDIAASFKGMSKADFKHAVGSLYKDGLIIPDKLSTTLVPKEHLPFAQTAAAQAQTEKRLRLKQQNGTNSDPSHPSSSSNSNGNSNMGGDPEFIERNNDCSVFLGNLPPTIDMKSLVTAIHAVILPENIVRIRLCKDQHGTPRGFGYLELAHEGLVDQAIAILKGHEVKGRKLRVDYADKEKRFRLAAQQEKEAGEGSGSDAEPWSTDDENEDVFSSNSKLGRRRRGPVGLPTKRSVAVLPASSLSSTTRATDNEDRESGSENDEFGDDSDAVNGALLTGRVTGSAIKPYTRRDGAVKVYNRRDSLNSDVDWENLDQRFEGPAKPSSPVRLDPSRPLPQATLFIGNLAFAVTETLLSAELQRFVAAEELASVRVILDKATGESRGFGFVDVYTTEAAEKVSVFVRIIPCVYGCPLFGVFYFYYCT